MKSCFIEKKQNQQISNGRGGVVEKWWFSQKENEDITTDTTEVSRFDRDYYELEANKSNNLEEMDEFFIHTPSKTELWENRMPKQTNNE